MNPTQTLQGAARTAIGAASTLAGYTRNTFYASIGILATLQEEAEKVFDQFVSEGRAVEAGRVKTLTAKAYHETREEVAEAQSEVEETAQEAELAAEQAGRKAQVQAKALEERVAESVTAVLQRMNVPTREDVESLKRSVERLDKKTADLRAA